MIKAVLIAGLYANVAVGEEPSEQDGHYVWKDATTEVRVHPSSVNHDVGSKCKPAHPFVVYHEKVRTTRVFLRDCTVVAPEALLLFGGALDVQHADARVVMDRWITIKCDAPIAVVFKYLRCALDADFARRIQSTGAARWSDSAEEDDETIVAIRRVLDER